MSEFDESQGYYPEPGMGDRPLSRAERKQREAHDASWDDRARSLNERAAEMARGGQHLRVESHGPAVVQDQEAVPVVMWSGTMRDLERLAAEDEAGTLTTGRPSMAPRQGDTARALRELQEGA